PVDGQGVGIVDAVAQLGFDAEILIDTQAERAGELVAAVMIAINAQAAGAGVVRVGKVADAAASGEIKTSSEIPARGRLACGGRDFWQSGWGRCCGRRCLFCRWRRWRFSHKIFLFLEDNIFL